MATSIRKKAYFSSTHAHGLEFASDESEDYKSEKKRLDHIKKKAAKINAQFHKGPEKHSFAHLANVLVGGDRTQMLTAVERLQGRSRVLAELAMFSTFPFVRLAAVSNLSGDIEALADIAKFCPHDDARAASIDELSSNTEAIIDVACSSFFKDTRLEAVSSLTNTHSLAKVASRSPNADSRSAAFEKLSSDPNALRKVADDSPYSSARKAALKKLSSNVPALSALLIGSKYPEVKRLAAVLLSEFVEDIDDAEVLVDIAKLSPAQDSRYLAVGRLWKHAWALRRIAFESSYKDVKSTALMLLSDLVPNIDDPEILAEVAILSPYEDCRSSAVERLVGHSAALLSVASKSKFKATRSHALHKLKGDVEALKGILRLSKYKDARDTAHKLVSEPDLFHSELARILG